MRNNYNNRFSKSKLIITNKKSINLIITALIVLIVNYKFFISRSKIEETILRKLFNDENPFGDINGWEPDITFIDEKLGFILLGTSNGDILYRTEDGGKTFNETALPGYMKYPEMCYAKWFTEYSKPTMPYKVNDKLYIKIKCSNPTKKTFELCKSNDNGLTWEVVKICSY